MSTLLLYAALFICSLLITACFLWLSTKLVKIPQITFWRALATLLVLTFVEFLAGFGVTILFQKFLPSFEAEAVTALLIGGVQVIASLFLSWLVIRWMFHTTFVKAILVWLSRVVAGGLMLACVFLVIKSFLL